MRHNSPALSDDGAGIFFSEGGWDERLGVVVERWICSVGGLRVEKVVFGGVWKKQQCGDNRAALGYRDHLCSVEMDLRECLRLRQTKAPRRKNGEGLMVL